MILKKRDGVRIVRRPRIVMACAAAAMLAFGAATGWGQAYYEASGQTAAFTLTPGATTGPDAIRHNIVSHPGKGNAICIATVKGGIVVTLLSQRHGFADISVYNIAGRQALRQRGFSGASLRFDTRRLAPGMYTVVVRIDGQIHSRRIAVSR